MTEPLAVVGDALLDVDVQARADRLVPDAAAPVLEEQSRRVRPGGAALAALLAARLSSRPVLLIAGVPDDDAGAHLTGLLPAQVTLVALPCTGRTPVKTRLRAAGQTVARLDAGTGPLEYAGLPTSVRAALREATAVLVSDYGGGATAHEPLRTLLGARAEGQPTVWDPHPRGAEPVAGLTLVTPNGREAAVASDIRGERIGARRRQAEALRKRWRARAVAVTLGGRGALLAYGDGAAELFPTEPHTGRDANGAGDCFAAATAITLADSGLPSDAVAAGVAAASRFVGADGDPRVLAGGTARPAAPQQAMDLAAAVRRRGGTVVATGGCFDLLHAGHIATLAAARSLGDCLIVCVNSDDSVRRLKGPDRPLQPAVDRLRVLSSLRYVDAVVVFEEDTPAAVLQTLRPDVWVKGGDYSAAALPEAGLVRSWGGEVVTVPYLAGRSTSRLVRSVHR